jgi:hypothetical protein
VEIYNVNIAANGIPRIKRLIAVVVLFAITVTAYFAVELATRWRWPEHNESDTVSQMFVQAIIWGLLMSIIFSFRKAPKYQIVVDDDEISTKNFDSMNRLYSRSIHRGQVRTLIERKTGLLVSRHNRFGTFLWGGVWVPKQLADYEYLKRLVSEWK